MQPTRNTGELKIGLIGVGCIGGFLLEAIQQGRAGRARVVAFAAKSRTEVELSELARKYECGYTREVGKLVEFGPDLVIEAAGQEVVRQWAIPLLEQNLDFMAVSAGALADSVFLEQVRAAAQRSRRKLYVPSGAIGGLDVLRAAGIDRLDEVKLITSKPPKAFAGAAFLEANGINLAAITERTTIFSGSAQEAVKLFPQNINVAAALSLAGLGAERTLVEIVADPHLSRNTHEVVARGGFGEMRLQLANLPCPDNPKTSFLACLSPLALLHRLSDPVWIGS